MFVVSSGFIGNFKLGDNIHFNTLVLQELYVGFNDGDANRKRLLCKPIIIQLVSIIEAMLYDFHFRVRNHTSEGIVNVGLDVMAAIRGESVDKFAKYIQNVKDHKIIPDEDGKLFDNLDLLRRLRNRVHIQNDRRELELDDMNAFSEYKKTLAERCLERIAKTLAEKYPRKKSAQGYVKDFEFPWNEHFCA
jgi:hypothetical protein